MLNSEILAALKNVEGGEWKLEEQVGDNTAGPGRDDGGCTGVEAEEMRRHRQILDSSG